ncbi:MAG: hypothetical protein NTX22_13905 [Ignavibacteriales bacterium]|nr:hypothetical protein [Ignavibacteriales bacterium]
MKSLLIAIILIPLLISNAQQLGEYASEKPAIVFPDRSLGVDFMFSEGGFGLGGFYRYNLSQSLTFFSDISFSEAKDNREVDYVDYYGRTYTPNKKNRIFLIPLSFGLQQRLFENVLTDNLRPYINFGIGPAMVATTPYEREFFNAFSKAQAKYTISGYIGLGANFGIDKSSLVGINIRYYEVKFFDKGVESLEGRFQNELGGFYLTINLGIMY